jgi:hypothetical protein
VPHGQGKVKAQKEQEKKEIREQDRMEQRSRLFLTEEEKGFKAAKTFNDFMLGLKGPIATHFQCHFENRRFKTSFDKVDLTMSTSDNSKKLKSIVQIYEDPLEAKRNTQDVYECEVLYISNYDISQFVQLVRDYYQAWNMSKKVRVTEDDFVVYVYFYYQSLLMDMLRHPTERDINECSYRTDKRTWYYNGTMNGWALMFPIPMGLVDLMIRSVGAGIKQRKCICFTPTLIRQGGDYLEWTHRMTFNEEDYSNKSIFIVGRGQGTRAVIDVPDCGFCVSHPSHQQILDLLFRGNTLMRDVISEKGYWYLPKGLYTYCVILAEELKKMKWGTVQFLSFTRCWNQRFPLVLFQNKDDKQSKVGIPKEQMQNVVELCKRGKFDISGCSATLEDPAWLAGGYML